jgi:hypothetical protein
VGALRARPVSLCCARWTHLPSGILSII